VTPQVAVHEVAVVGGGIAGAAACIALARHGLRPLWLTPEDDVSRDPVGETLAPAARPILNRLGLSHLLESPRHRRSNATFSAWGSERLVERNAAVHLEGPGLVLDRRAFERDIAAAAGDVAERRDAWMRSAQVEGDLWALGLDDGASVRARFVIDASGRAAVLGRRLSRFRRDDQLVAATALLPHRDLEVEPTPATLIEALRDGWIYSALLPDGRLSVAYFSDPDLLPANLSRDLDAWRALLDTTTHVRRWIADAGFGVEAPPRLASAGVTRLDPPAAAGADTTPGWAAAGDAAAAFDPLSSHGMTTALWTAARSGDAAADWLRGDRRPIDAYVLAVAKGAQDFLVQRASLYASETRFADAPFWQRRRQAA
jgi:flavin-dependent dehydrogenase